LKAYFKAYIEEVGKIDAQEDFGVDTEAQLKEIQFLRQEYQRLLKEIKGLKLQNRKKYIPPEEILVIELREWGLSEQKASELSPYIIEVLIEELSLEDNS